MANQYSIWTWGGTDVTFEGCTFNTNGKAILLYGQATAEKPTDLVVNNCTFNDRKSGAAGKAAIEVGNDYNATYTLTVNNTTVNGFAARQEYGLPPVGQQEQHGRRSPHRHHRRHQGAVSAES